MSLSLYQATVPQYLQILAATSGLLDKAEAWVVEQKVAPEDLLGRRVAPDMWPFATQVRQVVHHSANALKGVAKGRFQPDTDQHLYDFATLRALLDDATAYLNGLTPEDVNAGADREVEFFLKDKPWLRFTGANFLLSFSQPNFYFHVTMIYSILRGLGVGIGKRDYMGMLRANQPG